MVWPFALLLWHSWWIVGMGQAETSLAACPTCWLCGQWPKNQGRGGNKKGGAPPLPHTRSSWAACSHVVILASFLCDLSSYLPSTISSLRSVSKNWRCHYFKGHSVISYWRGLILDFKEGHSPPKWATSSFLSGSSCHVLFMTNSSPYTDIREVHYGHIKQHVTSLRSRK